MRVVSAAAAALLLLLLLQASQLRWLGDWAQPSLLIAASTQPIQAEIGSIKRGKVQVWWVCSWTTSG